MARTLEEDWTPRVSVIVTVYNKPQWLCQCINSVLDQTYEDFELLVMEDNSPDEEVKRILRLYQDPRMLLHFSTINDEDRYKTARYATLINEAVFSYAKGEFITYLTDDDFYYPQRLEWMVNYFDENPGVDVVYGAIHNVDAEGKVAGTRGAHEILDFAFDRVDHNAVMHTRASFLEVDGWDDNPGTWGGADAYMWRKLNGAGYNFYPLGDDKVVSAHRYHTDSVQWKISNNCFFPEDHA